MKRLLYLRNFAKELNIDSYNSQEIGICKALVSRGYSCDLVLSMNSHKVKVSS